MSRHPPTADLTEALADFRTRLQPVTWTRTPMQLGRVLQEDSHAA
ncbi:hypothetical protein ABZ260_29475 [Streptosporangium sp. NPDC006013]